jgi:hypothetical protein
MRGVSAASDRQASNRYEKRGAALPETAMLTPLIRAPMAPTFSLKGRRKIA